MGRGVGLNGTPNHFPGRYEKNPVSLGVFHVRRTPGWRGICLKGVWSRRDRVSKGRKIMAASPAVRKMEELIPRAKKRRNVQRMRVPKVNTFADASALSVG